VSCRDPGALVEAAAADGGRGGRGGSTRAGADAFSSVDAAPFFSLGSPASSLGTEGTRGAEPPPSSSSPKSYRKG
jgi:hypothetical protein